MEEKYLFNQVVSNYEKRRPLYGPQLFEEIKEYANLIEGKQLLEIGCGTGQATEPFLKEGCNVLAIELGENLATYTKEKYKNYSNFDVICSSFEDYQGEEQSIDLIYSATAFHWIPDEIGYRKTFRLLKSGGVLALFWNRPAISNEQTGLHQALQTIYNELVPHWKNREKRNEEKENAYLRIQNDIRKNGFTDLSFQLYSNTRKMNALEYIELLSTYSDHIALEHSLQTTLFQRIQMTIEEFGNEIIIQDTIDLYLARKP